MLNTSYPASRTGALKSARLRLSRRISLECVWFFLFVCCSFFSCFSWSFFLLRVSITRCLFDLGGDCGAVWGAPFRPRGCCLIEFIESVECRHVWVRM